MVLEIISALISASALIAVAYIQTTNNKKHDEATCRAQIRAKEMQLSLKMMDANAELCEVICIAVTGGHTNGNVEAARKKVADARNEYKEFLRQTLADTIK